MALINESELQLRDSRVININRVAKVVKGGRRFGFAALVVVGDQKGRVGYGSGKAREVPEAIRKATEQAKRSMIRVALKDSRTLHHDMEGRHGAGKVVMRSAVAGTGDLTWIYWWRAVTPVYQNTVRALQTAAGRKRDSRNSRY